MAQNMSRSRVRAGVQEERGQVELGSDVISGFESGGGEQGIRHRKQQPNSLSLMGKHFADLAS